MTRRLIFIFLITMLVLGLNVSQARAEGKYQIKQMTPEVSAALESRKSRYESLRELKSSGIIGENNKGYVEVLNDNGSAQSIVDAENKDRKTIYETIAKQNGLEGALATIEKVFAQVQRDKASAGDKIQQEDGSWTTK